MKKLNKKSHPRQFFVCGFCVLAVLSFTANAQDASTTALRQANGLHEKLSARFSASYVQDDLAQVFGNTAPNVKDIRAVFNLISKYDVAPNRKTIFSERIFTPCLIQCIEDKNHELSAKALSLLWEYASISDLRENQKQLIIQAGNIRNVYHFALLARINSPTSLTAIRLNSPILRQIARDDVGLAALAAVDDNAFKKLTEQFTAPSSVKAKSRLAHCLGITQRREAAEFLCSILRSPDYFTQGSRKISIRASALEALGYLYPDSALFGTELNQILFEQRHGTTSSPSMPPSQKRYMEKVEKWARSNFELEFTMPFPDTSLWIESRKYRVTYKKLSDEEGDRLAERVRKGVLENKTKKSLFD